MNAYDVLKRHHTVLKGLGRKVGEAPVNSEERHVLFDEMLIELDIHFRIEDDLYYPALSAAGKPITGTHAEHRQVVDQLATLLRTPQRAPGYEEEWNVFRTVLEAHADVEERDMIPAPTPVHTPMPSSRSSVTRWRLALSSCAAHLCTHSVPRAKQTS